MDQIEDIFTVITWQGSLLKVTRIENGNIVLKSLTQTGFIDTGREWVTIFQKHGKLDRDKFRKIS